LFLVDPVNDPVVVSPQIMFVLNARFSWRRYDFGRTTLVFAQRSSIVLQLFKASVFCPACAGHAHDRGLMVMNPFIVYILVMRRL